MYLGPRSGLWIGTGSLLWMALTKPPDIGFEMLQGTVVLELAALAERQRVILSCRGAEVSILEPGLYRLEADGATLTVFKGRAAVSVSGRRIELGVGEVAFLDRSPIKSAITPDAENTLLPWREWRARRGAPGDRALLPGEGPGRMSPGTFTVSGGSGPSGLSWGWARFTPGGSSGSMGPGSSSDFQTVFLNDRPIPGRDWSFPQAHVGDILRTTQSRFDVRIPGASIWVGEGSRLQIRSINPFSGGPELLEGTAVVDIAGINSTITLLGCGATITFREPGLYRLDTSPPALRVFRGTADVQRGRRRLEITAGRILNLDDSLMIVKFDRDTADSFGIWGTKKPTRPIPSMDGLGRKADRP